MEQLLLDEIKATIVRSTSEPEEETTKILSPAGAGKGTQSEASSSQKYYIHPPATPVTPPTPTTPKGGSGKGNKCVKGTGKGKKCWNCQQTGHIASNCTDPKVNSVEEPEEETTLDGLVVINSVDESKPKSAKSLLYAKAKHTKSLLDAKAKHVKSLLDAKGAYKIKIGVDSGAAVSVMMANACPDYPVQMDTQTGKPYVVASGSAIHDKGKRQYLAVQNGKLVAGQGRVCDVHKNLSSVFDMVQQGHKVTFDKDEHGQDTSHALHKETGMKIPFQLAGRVWDMELTVVPFETAKHVLPKSAGGNAVGTNPLGRRP